MVKLNSILDLDDPGAESFLEGLQGNIIKGHGRDFTRHILLRMTGDPQAVRRWIVDFAAQRVTTAAAARRSTEAWKARKKEDPGDSFEMFLLSADGYRHLGLQLPVPSSPFSAPEHEQYFRLGMKNQHKVDQRARKYNDPPSTTWEPAYQGRIDAMYLLADDDEERLKRSADEVVGSIPGIFEELTIEEGAVLRQTFESGEKDIEHFGFQDGVSQPIMIQQDLEHELSARGSTYWNPIAPLELALVPEPGSEPDSIDRLGSFMVFRKLEQDVKAFWDTISRLTAQTGIEREKAGAMAVGRFRDGRPVVEPVSTVDPTADPNDFHYGLDPRGGRCPFHAHIRKTNPRGDVPCTVGASAEFERARRIVRRGITYGKRPDLQPDSTLDLPSKDVGLLFMCFQSNLDQFTIQQEGSDGDTFVRAGTGVDAVIGQPLVREDQPPTAQTWPNTATRPEAKFLMANLVRMRGGEYFFAPSMTFLKGLAQA
jgi:Dyp-type peroxidase family